MGAYKEPHGDALKQLYLTETRRRAGKAARARLPLMEPDRAAAMRPRADPERRVLAARRVPDGGGVQASRARHAPALGRAVADSGDPRCLREFAGGTSKGEHIALRDPEGVLIATMEVRISGSRTRPKRQAAYSARKTSIIRACTT